MNSKGLANQQRLESLTEEVASAKKLLEKAHKDNDRVRAELEEKEYMSGGTVLMWCVILDCQQSHPCPPQMPHSTLAPLKCHTLPMPPSNATPHHCPPQMPHPTHVFLKCHTRPLPPSNATPHHCPPQMPHLTLAPQLLITQLLRILFPFPRGLVQNV